THAERAVALDGTSGEARGLLQEIARETGHPERATAFEDLLSGKRHAYLAACVPGESLFVERARVVLLARGSESGGVLAGKGGGGILAITEADAKAVPAAGWFFLRPDGSAGPVSGFELLPRVRWLTTRFGEGRVASFGESCVSGTIYATRPIAAVAEKEIGWEE